MNKKRLLSICSIFVSAVALASGLQLSQKAQLHPELMPEVFAVDSQVSMQGSPAQAPARASEGEIVYSPAGNPATTLAYNSQKVGNQLAMAVQVDPSFLADVKDGQITEISYVIGNRHWASKNPIKTATVFVADNLTGKFIYEQSEAIPNTTGMTSVKLTTPVDISSYKSVFFGVYFTITEVSNSPIIVDETAHANDYGGWVAIRDNANSSWQWDNLADMYGFVCLAATMKASSFPQNKVAILAADGQPTAYVNSPFDINYLIVNNGVNPVKEIEVKYYIGDEPVQTSVQKFDQPLELSQLATPSLTNCSSKTPAKSAEIKVEIIGVNGVANTSDNKSDSYTMAVIPQGSGFKQNVVIEEFTSTSCIYCPVGYTAMEEIHADFTDGTIIPVCVHVNTPGTDPMNAPNYNNIFYKFASSGVPSSTLNRQYEVYPFYDDLVNMAHQLQSIPAFATVSATAKVDKETRKITIDAKTSFSFDYADGADNFRLSFGITENNVGPYRQQNGYSGTSGAVPGDWQNQPSTVQLTYNDVARQLSTAAGVQESIPNEIKAGAEYSFSHSFTLVRKVTDLSNINVVVYLINPKDLTVVNACVIYGPIDDAAGIESITVDDSNAPAEFFNLQGVRVAEPSNGVYIRRQGSKTEKVYIK